MQSSQQSWISPLVEVRQSHTSKEGTFAKDFIKKGTLIMVQGGRIVTGDQLDTAEYEPVWYHAFQVEKELYIVPFKTDDWLLDAIFKVNHACDPSCGMHGPIALVAMRDLQPGDEITFDYAMCDVDVENENWEAMECNCGAAICRKTVSGHDWKDPELQAKYEGYFSPYVQKLIEKY